jgi:hypothetical protein
VVPVGEPIYRAPNSSKYQRYQPVHECYERQTPNCDGGQCFRR